MASIYSSSSSSYDYMMNIEYSTPYILFYPPVSSWTRVDSWLFQYSKRVQISQVTNLKLYALSDWSIDRLSPYRIQYDSCGFVVSLSYDYVQLYVDERGKYLHCNFRFQKGVRSVSSQGSQICRRIYQVKIARLASFLYPATTSFEAISFFKKIKILFNFCSQI